MLCRKLSSIIGLRSVMLPTGMKLLCLKVFIWLSRAEFMTSPRKIWLSLNCIW